MGGPGLDGEGLIGRLGGLAGGPELLDLAGEREGVELVGGAVRDLLLGRAPRELDVVVDRDADALAGQLAARLGTLAGRSEHERFGTALVWWEGGRIDIATRRAESYPASGALPEVRDGTPTEDLERRDFSVNAIALGLSGAARGLLRTVPHALEDLAAGSLRVLHDHSFSEDPTRLLRLARYRARLEFAVEPHTAQLARQALDSRALDNVSGARIGAELRLALGEADALGALAAMDDLGLLSTLHPRLRFEQERARAALALLPVGGGPQGAEDRPDLLLLAALTLPLALRAGDDRRAEIASLLDRLEFPAGDRDRAAAAAAAVPRLVGELPSASTPAQLRGVVAKAPPEGVALAGAVSEPAAEPARRWLGEVRGVRLRIDGEDLLAAGVPQGPEIGARLERVLCERLDGDVPDEREAQLRTALEGS